MERALLIGTVHLLPYFCKRGPVFRRSCSFALPNTCFLVKAFPQQRRLHHHIISNRQTSTPRAWRAADQRKLQSSTSPREFRRSARISYARATPACSRQSIEPTHE